MPLNKKQNQSTKTPGLVKPHHQIVLCHNRTLIGGIFFFLQRCSQCILLRSWLGQWIKCLRKQCCSMIIESQRKEFHGWIMMLWIYMSLWESKTWQKYMLEAFASILDDRIYHLVEITFPRLLLGRLAFVPDGVSINGRFEAERPPASVGPPSGGRATFMTHMHPLYSTRTHGLVQAIFWHTCPDLDLGPWYCLTH